MATTPQPTKGTTFGQVSGIHPGVPGRRKKKRKNSMVGPKWGGNRAQWKPVTNRRLVLISSTPITGTRRPRWCLPTVIDEHFFRFTFPKSHSHGKREAHEVHPHSVRIYRVTGLWRDAGGTCARSRGFLVTIKRYETVRP